MSSLTAWLFAILSPLLGRIFVTLGFSVVTVVGMEAVLTTVKNTLVSHMQTIPAAALQLALLSGAGVALGMIFGAVSTRLLLWKLTSATRILGTRGA